MDIPLNADVQCTDSPCGRSTTIIVNPITRRVTHLVVAEQAWPHVERTVPLDLVTGSTPNSICLSCTRHEFLDLQTFIETEYVAGDESFLEYEADEYRMLPYVVPESAVIPVDHERIPPGELAVHRGARVEATDGHVGRVDEFLVDPKTEHITHLVLREGHLWGQKDVTIPLSQIARIDLDTVYLKLSKRDIEAMPSVRVRR
jgi:sporulation protein YlmC with PRC-barrel domain